jgi:hypothetical protein
LATLHISLAYAEVHPTVPIDVQWPTSPVPEADVNPEQLLVPAAPEVTVPVQVFDASLDAADSDTPFSSTSIALRMPFVRALKLEATVTPSRRQYGNVDLMKCWPGNVVPSESHALQVLAPSPTGPASPWQSESAPETPPRLPVYVVLDTKTRMHVGEASDASFPDSTPLSATSACWSIEASPG